MSYVGRVNRFTKTSEKEIVNRSFYEYLVQTQQLHLLGPVKARGGEQLHGQYRMVFSNMVASFKSVSKYDKGQPELDEGAWLLAGDWTKQHWFPYVGGSGVLSQDDALGEMEMSTSCGYPWSLKFPTKTEFLADQKAREALEDYWGMIGIGGNDMVPIWTCSQKVELRSLEKLAANKVRTFTASPIEHSVALNRMCLDFNNRFYASAGQTWSFVGATKYLQGWDQLYRRLNRLPHAFELDESDYDSSLFARLMYGQCELRWSMYAESEKTEENRKRLWALYDSIVKSVIVLENGELVQKFTGNPSGSANTIVDNTMALFRLFAYAWIVLCKKLNREMSYLEFMKEVEAALNGDDNTFTVSEAVVGWFNPTTIAPVWTKIGVTTKTPDEAPRALKDVSFLSQSFQFDEGLGVWMPVPETAKVLCSLMYGSDVDDVRWHYLRACALRIDSYGDSVCRSVLAGYINYLNVKHRAEMIGVVNGLTIREIQGVWKSDDAIRALYAGLESRQDVGSEICKIQALLKNRSDQSTPISVSSHLLPGEQYQSFSRNMAKTAAQKARRRARKAALKLKVMQPTKGKRGPIFINPQPVGGKKNKKNKARPMFNSPLGPSNNRLGLGSGVSNFSTTRKSQVVEEDEYIGEIAGSVAFATTGYSVNPGQAAVFPWGSKVAQLYEEYSFDYLEFYYKREVSEFATNGQAGKVILSFDYDATDSAPLTKQQVEDSDPHVDGMPCTPLLRLPLDCAAMRRSDAKYVRPGAQPANTDLKTYDVGTLYVSTSGCANTSTIGELHVRYRVRFSKPVLNLPLGEGLAAAAYNAAGVIAVGAPMGTSITQIAGSSFAVTLASATTIAMPAVGRFLVAYTTEGTTLAVNNFFAASTNTTLVRQGYAGAPATGIHGSGWAVFDVTAPGGVFTLCGFTSATQTSAVLEISQIPSALTVVSAEEQEHEQLLARLQRLELLLSGPPPVHVAVRRLQQEENKEDLDDALPDSSSDELDKSVHIPRGVLSKFMRK